MGPLGRVGGSWAAAWGGGWARWGGSWAAAWGGGLGSQDQRQWDPPNGPSDSLAQHALDIVGSTPAPVPQHQHALDIVEPTRCSARSDPAVGSCRHSCRHSCRCCCRRRRRRCCRTTRTTRTWRTGEPLCPLVPASSASLRPGVRVRLQRDQRWFSPPPTPTPHILSTVGWSPTTSAR